MIMIKFRSSDEHSDLLKKVKHMKKYISELEDCLEEAVENENLDYRDRRYPEYESDEDEESEFYKKDIDFYREACENAFSYDEMRLIFEIIVANKLVARYEQKLNLIYGRIISTADGKVVFL